MSRSARPEQDSELEKGHSFSGAEAYLNDLDWIPNQVRRDSFLITSILVLTAIFSIFGILVVQNPWFTLILVGPMIFWTVVITVAWNWGYPKPRFVRVSFDKMDIQFRRERETTVWWKDVEEVGSWAVTQRGPYSMETGMVRINAPDVPKVIFVLRDGSRQKFRFSDRIKNILADTIRQHGERNESDIPRNEVSIAGHSEA